MIIVFLYLRYLTQYDVFKLHPFACKFQNISIFFICVIFHCINVPYFPSPFLVKGHLGCFHVLVMTINATMNIVKHMACGRIENPLDTYPKVVLLGLEEGCFLIF